MAVLVTGIMGSIGLGLGLIVLIADKGNSTVRVTGVSTKRVLSDNVKWILIVKQDDQNQKDAFKQHQNNIRTTLVFLANQGIAKDNIHIGILNSKALEKYNREIGISIRSGCRLSQELTINSLNVDKIKNASKASSFLIGQGVNVQIKDPVYTYSLLNKIRPQILADATKDAKARASKIALESGQNLGRLISMGNATFQITAPNLSSVGSSGKYDTSTIEKDITAVMSANFKK
mgnify:CR=1 FL=1